MVCQIKDFVTEVEQIVRNNRLKKSHPDFLRQVTKLFLIPQTTNAKRNWKIFFSPQADKDNQ